MSVHPTPVRRWAPRAFAIAFLTGGAVSLLTGCPIFADTECNRSGTCASSSSSSSGSTACFVSSDCGTGYVCTSAGRCVVSSTQFDCVNANDCTYGQTCGRDGICSSQDCTYVGCVQGTCLLSGGVASCVVLGTRDAGTDSGCVRSDGGDGGDASTNCGTTTTDGGSSDSGNDSAADAAH